MKEIQQNEKRYRMATRTSDHKSTPENSYRIPESKEISPKTPEQEIDENQGKSTKSGKKRIQCSKCNDYVHKKSMRIHLKYYCGKDPDEREWKLCSSLALCKCCNKMQDPDAIEFHCKYLCMKKIITVQCFYCPRLFNDYRGLLKHMNSTHKKKHRYLDLLSILPVADSIVSEKTPQKVVKHFFNNTLNVEGEAFLEGNSNAPTDVCMQFRKKTTYQCEKCGKKIVGTHAYENHINTNCESEDYYSCFFCSYKTVYAFETLEHMEADHDQKFNTYDLIQARMTGIIPIIENDSAGATFEEFEIDFANRQLYEPYIPPEIAEDSKPEQEKLSTMKISKLDVNSKAVAGSARSIKFKNNFSLKVSKRRSKVLNRVLSQRKHLKKRKPVVKITCLKCNKAVHPNDMRMHKKYHCGKESTTEWILKSGKAYCLKCKTPQMSETIDFHVRYLCKKKPIAMQCFYCPHIAPRYRMLLGHMRKAHNKSHYFQDLLSILPQAEDDHSRKSPQKSGAKLSNTSKVFKLPRTFEPPLMENRSMTLAGCVKFPLSEDFYTCFYCEYKNKAGFKVLDHLEDMHGEKHNLFDLLQAKMASSTPVKQERMPTENEADVSHHRISPIKLEIPNGINCDES